MKALLERVERDEARAARHVCVRCRRFLVLVRAGGFFEVTTPLATGEQAVQSLEPGDTYECPGCGAEVLLGRPSGDAGPALVVALRLVLAFYRVGPWTDEDRAAWRAVTGSVEVSSKVLCGYVQGVLRALVETRGA